MEHPLAHEEPFRATFAEKHMFREPLIQLPWPATLHAAGILHREGSPRFEGAARHLALA